MLDDGEMLEGYLDGFHGEAAPDSSRRPPDRAYLALADAFLDLAPRH